LDNDALIDNVILQSTEHIVKQRKILNKEQVVKSIDPSLAYFSLPLTSATGGRFSANLLGQRPSTAV
jgi:hypothetical protein